MGQGMPKAVTSVVVKRWGSKPFRVGLAEMNGWRPSMEDAHVVVMHDAWGFFGVLDGHGGSQCSAYVASRLTEELERDGKPVNDEAVTALALKLDKEYLDLNQPSGSTGTFVIVTQASGGKTYGLRVGNIGDSRVLLGKHDGTMIEGGGSDGCLTTDHKPDHPSEKARIERTGGTVQEVMGVSRVNGDLAVSRAFGDAQYKETGGPAQVDHPVIAAPELFTLDCSDSDFLILVCDGISECNFPNREVVQYAADELKKSLGSTGVDQMACHSDPGAAAAAVCRRALERGSKDNLSCMIVLLGSEDPATTSTELLPGAVDSLNHDGFRKAYEYMAGHANMNLTEAVEARYEVLQEEVEGPECTQELQQELQGFGEGPPPNLTKGSEERLQWFSEWVQSKSAQQGGGDNQNLMQTLMADPGLLQRAQQHMGVPQDKMPAEREPVVAAGEEELRHAIQGHFALQWDARYLGVCGKEGIILKRDDSDNTSQVRFFLDNATGPMTAWFPNETLKPPNVQVAGLDELRSAITESSHVEWDDDKHPKIQGNKGLMLRIDDSKEASLVLFPESGDELWLPTCTVSRE